MNANYQQAFAEWKRIAQEARQRGKELDDSVQEQGWKLAASVGIGRCGCSLHNASIDDKLQGWCKDNPARLIAAKRANHLVNQWDGSRAADKIIKAAWNRLIAEPFGFCRYELAN